MAKRTSELKKEELTSRAVKNAAKEKFTLADSLKEINTLKMEIAELKKEAGEAKYEAIQSRNKAAVMKQDGSDSNYNSSKAIQEISAIREELLSAQKDNAEFKQQTEELKQEVSVLRKAIAETQKTYVDGKNNFSERRVNFLLWFFCILVLFLGVVIPLLLAFRNADKTENAINDIRKEWSATRQEMNAGIAQNQKDVNDAIKELKDNAQKTLSSQGVSPDMTFMYKGAPLQGKTIHAAELGSIEFFNKGQGVARNIKVIIYTKENSALNIRPYGDGWTAEEKFDEKGYQKAFSRTVSSINPRDSEPLNARFSYNNDNEIKENILIKAYFGQPQPARTVFTIVNK